MSDAPLGVFSRLPAEIREMIWLYFVPVAVDKTDLRVLQTNHSMYNEISEVIYRHSFLEFVLTPSFNLNTVFFARYKGVSRQNTIAPPLLRGFLANRSSSVDDFMSFPFHKLSKVHLTLNLEAMTSWGWQESSLLARAYQLNILLTAIVKIPCLHIRIRGSRDVEGRAVFEQIITPCSAFRDMTTLTVEYLDPETHSTPPQLWPSDLFSH
ncbi:hypothetical protein LOZ65_003052 [Ophidiomyces ophidiicola]|nr:hypothetical protein LOZ65_003052 [Ophidiomyces ophidiicola]